MKFCRDYNTTTVTTFKSQTSGKRLLAGFWAWHLHLAARVAIFVAGEYKREKEEDWQGNTV